MVDTKVCSKCGIEKLVEEFDKRSDSKDGFRNNCRLCRNNCNTLNRRKKGIRTLAERSKDPEWIRKNKEHLERMHKDPTWLENVTKAAQKRSQDPKWIENHKIAIEKRSHNEQWIENITIAAQKRAKDPVWIENNKKAMERRSQDPEWREMMSKRNKEMAKDPEWIKHQKESAQKRAKDPVWIENNRKHLNRIRNDPDCVRNHKDGVRRYSKSEEGIKSHKEGVIKRSQNPNWKSNLSISHRKENLSMETRKNISIGQLNKSKEAKRKTTEAVTKRNKRYDSRLKVMEYNVGGFCYSHVKYNDKRDYYCELWTPELRADQIRPYWDYKSVLSGKTKDDNKGKDLACHHVYYQKKACCIWDEDINGYYVWIDHEKYYIKGDPNKFVTLTNAENLMVNHDKLKWVKIFEDIIESQGGKCYFTKQEVEEMKASQEFIVNYLLLKYI
jgi:hypothetical protein